MNASSWLLWEDRHSARLRTTAHLRITGVIDDSRLGRSTWIVRLGCDTQNTAAQLTAALAGRPDTHYVDLAAGGTEVICAVTPRSSHERDDLLLEQLQRTPHVSSVSAHCVLHAYYGNSLRWLRKISALEPDEETALRAPAAEVVPAPVALDATDHTLLEALRRDGRATLTDLQGATGLSETAVKKRLERLRATGVLYLAVEYDHEPLGHGVEALVWLTVAPHALAGTGRRRPPGSTLRRRRHRADQPRDLTAVPHHRRPLHIPQREDRRPDRRPHSGDRPHPATGQSPHNPLTAPVTTSPTGPKSRG
ncbi:Lrp/AsnC family transcriptional regulator [Streptomyces sp. NBC_01236]|uniref:Lrp/AsnC family transcriptional regulator n=1 Tax=Streptomyces sp. NBC_01236 TaxID=2903789 RepID=UPI002E119769|nr:Lrp/AsnC family transcriptional regulator [Streptomyces sp. NBC_01236]